MFSCYLCEKETTYTTYFCVNCSKIQSVIRLIGSKTLLDKIKLKIEEVELTKTDD